MASRTRLTLMGVVGVAAAIVCGLFGHWSYSPLVGWDAAALAFAIRVWLRVIIPMDADATASHATREDPGVASTDLITLTAAVVSLAAVGYVLIQAKSAHGAAQGWLAGLGVASIALSWIAVHSLFTLRYAKLYYSAEPGGIDFNQDEPPRYLDFAYLSFTLGMTFQVSDTDLQTPQMRATALRHALLSYLFGAVILASTINLISSLG